MTIFEKCKNLHFSGGLYSEGLQLDNPIEKKTIEPKIEQRKRRDILEESASRHFAWISKILSSGIETVKAKESQTSPTWWIF